MRLSLPKYTAANIVVLRVLTITATLTSTILGWPERCEIKIEAFFDTYVIVNKLLNTLCTMITDTTVTARRLAVGGGIRTKVLTHGECDSSHRRGC